MQTCRVFYLSLKYFSVSDSFSTAHRVISSVLYWSGTNCFPNGHLSTDLSHICCVFYWSGISSNHGSVSAAFSHISWFLRWSGTKFNKYGLMNTALSHIFLLSNIDQEIISMTINFLKDIPHSFFCLIQIRNKFQPLISYIFWVLLYDTLSESQSLLTSIVNILVTYFCLWKSLDATFTRPLYYRFWGSSYEMDS